MQVGVEVVRVLTGTPMLEAQAVSEDFGAEDGDQNCRQNAVRAHQKLPADWLRALQEDEEIDQCHGGDHRRGQVDVVPLPGFKRQRMTDQNDKKYGEDAVAGVANQGRQAAATVAEGRVQLRR